MKTNIGYENITVNGGFWKEKQNLIRNTTIHSIYNRFKDTGRIDAFSCNWKEGEPNKPHFFWDSDVAKWIESVAYITSKKRDLKLEALADSIIDMIEKNQGDDGYFNIYFTVVAPSDRFKFRRQHELYCAGHLIEAAVEYKKATGKDKLYNCMKRYADYIYKVFFVEKSAEFVTPGHEEIELALVKLYRESGDKKYLELSKFFVDSRGNGCEKDIINPKELEYNYSQDRIPVREMKEAEGHAVRFFYLCCGMADIAYEYSDKELLDACNALFENTVNKKMYITGGLGSNCNNEGFDEDYYLPNETAYNETCASIAMVLFAMRMQTLGNSSEYADVIERELYNGFLSGLSLDGKSFFYENPLEINIGSEKRLMGAKKIIKYPIKQRVEVFECSCCPPNITRLISSMGQLIYTSDENSLRVNQYIESSAEFEGYSLNMKTDYPSSGKVEFDFKGKNTKVGFRIPFWCDKYSFKLNGKSASGNMENGYFYLDLKDGDSVSMLFDMDVKIVEANPHVSENAGRIAVMRGPVVYCVESKDYSLSDIRIDTSKTFEVTDSKDFGVPCIKGTFEKRVLLKEDSLYSYRKYERENVDLLLIPYFAFANRGEQNMEVWILEKNN